MRTFVALNLSPELRAGLHAAVEPARASIGRGVSWTREDALHLTLKFLGDQPDDVADRLAERIAPSLQAIPSLTIRLGGLGAFPSLARPRVLWIGVEANPDLSRLYQEIETACAALGVPREQRPFHPHVTVGRVRPTARVDGRLLSALAAEVRYDAVERVATVDVMESMLGPGGARYRLVSAVPLGDEDEEA
jgi:RNA 2',3'-cyclic 3'-phosphodiesterase